MKEICQLFFHDRPQKKQKWLNFLQDPIFIPIHQSPTSPSLQQHRNHTLLQLQKISSSGLLSINDLTTDSMNIFTANQMLGAVSASVTTKLTVHYNLFGGSILSIGTKQHEYILQKLDRLEIFGCFCLSQLGFGNNAASMQTTATYKQSTKQFIINSPTVLSQKYWIGNGLHANMAVVFAQTYIKSRLQGIHAFLIIIRDKQGKLTNGVHVKDLGQKIGLNGVDNSAIVFRNVRIPVGNMLDKYSHIDDNGQLVSSVSGMNQRFFKVTQRLLSGRLCIASMTLGSIKTIIYITYKYSKNTKISNNNNNNNNNNKQSIPIYDTQLVQNTLIPIISRTVMLIMLHNHAKSVFVANSNINNDDNGNTRSSSGRGCKDNMNTSVNTGISNEQLFRVCSVDKVLMSQHAEYSIAKMREICGNQGLLTTNYFGEAIANSHGACTAEGDNKILMIKIAKDILKSYSKSTHNKSQQYTTQPTLPFAHLSTPDAFLSLLQDYHSYLIPNLSSKITQLINQGIPMYNIVMFNISNQLQKIAQIYGEILALRYSIQCVHKMKEKQSMEVMIDYIMVFCYGVVIREMRTMICAGMIGIQTGRKLVGEYEDIVKKAAKNVGIIIEALNISQNIVWAPIIQDIKRQQKNKILPKL